jgi:Mn2+/Fe2+ NRAMP family transporter
MYLLVAASFVAVPLLVLARHSAPLAPAAAGPRHPAPPSTVFMVIALIGTTVAPWQLFFQQSNVVDKRITARWLRYERADTVAGTLLFALGAVAILFACALAFAAAPLHGAFVDASTVAGDLRHQAGQWAGALFAVALLNGSILGAGAVTLSASYAIGDVSGFRHSLHRTWRDAPRFHGSYAALVVLAATIVLIPGAPLGIVTTGVQALAGVLLPSALVFLLLLCNDRAVLGPWVNARWLNVIAATVVAVLLVLSGLLTTSTLFPRAEDSWLVTAILVISAGALGVLSGLRLSSRDAPSPPGSDLPGKPIWTMPPIETLPPPVRSPARTVALVILRAYILLAGLAVLVKIAGLIAMS